MASRCRIAVVVLLLLASVAAIITIAVIQDQWKTYEYEYGIVIDSGSSRSNVYLYHWPGNKQNDTGVVEEKLNCRVQGDGISAMKIDPEKDAKSWTAFQKCMDEIMKTIPAEKHQNTSLFLGATAGMRLLEEENKTRSDDILASLEAYLTSLPFNFMGAKIITGQQEGLYGWITVNYLKGNFLEKHTWNAYIHPSGAKTVGSMDLGGASTQIAFSVQDDANGEDYLPVHLYGYPYNVYTHSFLCYGKNEAEKRVMDKILKLSKDLSYVENPCYQEGFNITVKASSIYDSECTKKPKDFNPDQDIFMVGIPDSDKCGTIVRSIFDFASCSGANCSFNGVHQPPVSGDFMAYAGYFYVARALLSGIPGTTELGQFIANTKQLCHTHWTVLQEQKHWVSTRHLKTYCFSAHYILTILKDGYKFNEETWKNIDFQREVRNTSVGWSLGYMLSASNMLPSEAKELFPMSNPLYAGLIFLFSALTIITVVLLFISIVRYCY